MSVTLWWAFSRGAEAMLSFQVMFFSLWTSQCGVVSSRKVNGPKVVEVALPSRGVF